MRLGKAGLVRLKAEDTKTDEARLTPLTSKLTALLRDLYKVRYLLRTPGLSGQGTLGGMD